MNITNLLYSDFKLLLALFMLYTTIIGNGWVASFPQKALF